LAHGSLPRLGLWRGHRSGIYALNTFSFLQSNGGTPVPEAGSYALMLSGLAVLGWMAVRRRRR
jgi:hypothetical protein